MRGNVIFYCWLVALTFIFRVAEAQPLVGIGIFDAGSNTLEVRIKPNGPFDGIPSNIAFSIRWSAASEVHLGEILQSKAEKSYIPMLKSGEEHQAGGYRYQVFAGFGFSPMKAFAINWEADKEVVLFRIPFEGGISKFEIVNDSWTGDIENNADFYVSLAGKNKTGLIYHPAADFCNFFEVGGKTTTVLCYKGSNGAIAVEVTGGKKPYKFKWSEGPKTKDLKNIKAGHYTITVSDKSGCAIEKSFTVNQPFPLPAPNIYLSENILTSPSFAKYQWYLNGAPIAGAKRLQLKVTAGGYYHLVARNESDCELKSKIFNLDFDENGVLKKRHELKLSPNYEGTLLSFELITENKDTYQIEITDHKKKMIYSTDLKAFVGHFTEKIDLGDSRSNIFVVKVTDSRKQSAFNLHLDR